MEFGGILHDREKVLDIEPGTVVSIKTVNNTYKARSVVITVGKIHSGRFLLSKIFLNLLFKLFAVLKMLAISL